MVLERAHVSPVDVLYLLSAQRRRGVCRPGQTVRLARQLRVVDSPHDDGRACRLLVLPMVFLSQDGRDDGQRVTHLEHARQVRRA